MISVKPPSFAGVFPDRADSARAPAGVMNGVGAEAERLAARVRAAAPDREGALRDSVQARRGGDRVIIEAGGPETTKTSRAGPYDHALAVEFGTRKAAAEPFFYPTVRAGRRALDQAARSSMKNLKE